MALNASEPLPVGLTPDMTTGRLVEDSSQAPAMAAMGNNPFEVKQPGAVVGNIRGARKLSKGEAWTRARRMEQEANFGYSGVARAVVLVNFNPFRLSVNGGMLFNTSVPACPLDKPYVSVVLDQTKWTTQDQGVGLDNVEHFYPVPCHPAEQACEYIREYNIEREHGGVLIFFGTAVPKDLDEIVEVPVQRTTDDEFATNRIERVKRNLKEMWDESIHRRNIAILRQLQEATANYENDNTRHLVNDNHRDLARMALREHLIPELPRWVMVANLIVGEKKAEPCPACGAIPLTGAAICKVCNGFVFDVVKAYDMAVIPWGHVAMERATEEEMIAMIKIRDQRQKVRDKLVKKGFLEAEEEQ